MSSQILSKPLPYLALLLAHLIWGANFVVAKITLQEFPPMSLALLRFAFASLLIAPFFFAGKNKITRPSYGGKIKMQDYPKLIAVGVLIITLNITFFFEGIKRTTVINASVLTLIIPMLSVLLGWLFLKEKIYLINLAGIAVGFFGAIIIIGLPELLLGDISPRVMLGNILLILASISWVVGAVISRGLLRKYPSLTVIASAFMVGTITFFLPAAKEYAQNPNWFGNISMLGIFGLVYMTLLSSVSAYFLFEWGLARVGVIKADLFQYIEPFVAAGLAVIILGEKITIPFLAGAALIIAGVYLGTLAKETHHKIHKAHRM